MKIEKNINVTGKKVGKHFRHSDAERFMALLPCKSHILTPNTPTSGAYWHCIYIVQAIEFVSKSYMPSICDISNQNK